MLANTNETSDIFNTALENCVNQTGSCLACFELCCENTGGSSGNQTYSCERICPSYNYKNCVEAMDHNANLKFTDDNGQHSACVRYSHQLIICTVVIILSLLLIISLKSLFQYLLKRRSRNDSPQYPLQTILQQHADDQVYKRKIRQCNQNLASLTQRRDENSNRTFTESEVQQINGITSYKEQMLSKLLEEDSIDGTTNRSRQSPEAGGRHLLQRIEENNPRGNNNKVSKSQGSHPEELELLNMSKKDSETSNNSSTTLKPSPSEQAGKSSNTSKENTSKEVSKVSAQSCLNKAICIPRSRNPADIESEVGYIGYPAPDTPLEDIAGARCKDNTGKSMGESRSIIRSHGSLPETRQRMRLLRDYKSKSAMQIMGGGRGEVSALSSSVYATNGEDSVQSSVFDGRGKIPAQWFSLFQNYRRYRDVSDGPSLSEVQQDSLKTSSYFTHDPSYNESSYYEGPRGCNEGSSRYSAYLYPLQSQKHQTENNLSGGRYRIYPGPVYITDSDSRYSGTSTTNSQGMQGATSDSEPSQPLYIPPIPSERVGKFRNGSDESHRFSATASGSSAFSDMGVYRNQTHPSLKRGHVEHEVEARGAFGPSVELIDEVRPRTVHRVVRAKHRHRGHQKPVRPFTPLKENRYHSNGQAQQAAQPQKKSRNGDGGGTDREVQDRNFRKDERAGKNASN